MHLSVKMLIFAYMGRRKKGRKRDIGTALIFFGVLCLLVVSSVWAVRTYFKSPPYVDPDRYPVRGIDISRHNGEVNFEKVKNSGIDFVFIKASEGVTYQDSLFHRNILGAQRWGLKTGAYHFFRFDSEGVDQAVNFLNVLGKNELDLGLVIDVEKAGNPDVPLEDIKRRLGSMVEYLNLLGHRVMIYTNIDGYYDYIQETLPGCPLWICGFQQNPINAEWLFWQYDHHGKVSGVDGDVDMNTFFGSRDEWDKYLASEVGVFSCEIPEAEDEAAG